MPRVKQKASDSLKSLCLRSISDNIDKIWSREFLQNYYGKTHYLFVLGPFDDLPPRLIHEVLVTLKERKLLRKHHCYLLISPYFKSLNLSHCEENLGLLLQLSQQRCYCLLELDLSHNKLPKELTLRCLPALSNLTSLSFSFSSLTDSQLSVVGVYMPRLTSLDLSYCLQVSDSGLLSVLLPQDPSGREDPRYGQCCQLSRLLVAGCQNITGLSIRQALLRLPHLAVCDFPDTAGLVHQLVLDTKMEWSLRLRSLHSGLDSGQDSLAVSTKMCQEAEHAFIVLHPAQTAHCLLSLLDLQTVRELHLREELADDEAVSETGLMLGPVLVRHGQTLVSLNIAECHHVNVSLICTSCTQLTHLVLLWNKSYVSDHTDGGGAFPGLKTVNLAFLTDKDGDANLVRREMSSTDLCLILSSPTLQSLKVSHSRQLTDLSYTSVYSKNSMVNLKILELDQCHHISMDSLEYFLEDPNSLESVRFIKCEQITKREIQKYQRKVNKLKWNIRIDWS